MADTRHKDANWELRTYSDGTVAWSLIQIAILMDIRDELKLLNQTFRCYKFQRVPDILQAIRLNTVKKRKKPKA